MSTLAAAQAKIRSWRENVAQFAFDNFQFEPDPWQRELFDAFPSLDPIKRRIALQACAGPGKTAGLAICGWNFLACYASKGEHPKGAAVAITRQNLDDNLWSELAKWRERSAFLTNHFEWTSERIFAKQHPETWFLSARSWPKTANADEQGRTLSGLHSRYVLYLIDESGDIAPAVARAADQGLSNCAWGKILQAGNPTSHVGMLYQAASAQRHLWHVIRITGDPDDPQRSPRIDIEWAREQIKTYGRDNPWVMAYILGMFPPGGINALIGPDDIETAMRRHLREDQYNFAARVLGVDVALYGDDRTVIFPRQGLASFRPIVLRNAKPVEIAARIVKAHERWPVDAVFLDNTAGWAAGTLDLVQRAGLPAFGIDFGGKPSDPRYHNKRAEMAFTACEWIKNGGALAPDPELTRELVAHTYSLTGAGKFIVEPKDKIKEALAGHSPDLADALFLSHAMPIVPALRHPITGEPVGAHTVHEEYDPFHD